MLLKFTSECTAIEGYRSFSQPKLCFPSYICKVLVIFFQLLKVKFSFFVLLSEIGVTMFKFFV